MLRAARPSLAAGIGRRFCVLASEPALNRCRCRARGRSPCDSRSPRLARHLDNDCRDGANSSLDRTLNGDLRPARENRYAGRLKIALDATYSLGRICRASECTRREILNGLARAHPEARFLFCYRPHRFLRSFSERLPANAAAGCCGRIARHRPICFMA